MQNRYANQGSLLLATTVATELTTLKMRLFKSTFNPMPSNVLADFVAAEAAFSGYPAGGIAITWGTAFYAPGGGAAVNSQLAQFNSATPFSATDTIGGYWLDNGTVALLYAVFDNPVSMGLAGQSLPASAQLVFGF